MRENLGRADGGKGKGRAIEEGPAPRVQLHN